MMMTMPPGVYIVGGFFCVSRAAEIHRADAAPTTVDLQITNVRITRANDMRNIGDGSEAN